MNNIYFLIRIFFLTLPLYYTSVLRIKILNFSINFNIFIILLLGIIVFLKNLKVQISLLEKKFFLLLILFCIYHVLLYNDNISLSIYFSYVIKIFLDLFIFIIIFLITRYYINNIDAYLKIFVYSSTILLSFFIYYYFFVLKASFLGILFPNNELTTYGKNQAQIYMALEFPIALYLFFKYRNLFLFISILIDLFAIVYIGSRGLWVSLLLVFILLIFFKIKLKELFLFIYKKSLLIILSILTIFVLTIHGFNLPKKHFAEAIDAFNKIIKLYKHEGKLPSDSSATEREFFIKFGIKNFFNNIFLGNGLGFFFTFNPYKKVSHNDYIFFLCDIGLIGFILFISIILGSIFLLKDFSFLLLPFYIDLLFINAYNIPLFWILLGIYLNINYKGKYNV